MTPLLLLFLACTPSGNQSSPQVPAEYVDPGLDQTGASRVFSLAREEARYSLPDDSRPATAPIASRVPVEMRKDRGGPWKGNLPFEVIGSRRYPPPGVRVFLDGEPLRFDDRGPRSWSASERTVPPPRVWSPM